MSKLRDFSSKMFIKFWHIIVMQAAEKTESRWRRRQIQFKNSFRLFYDARRREGKFMLITFHHFYGSKRFWF